MPEGKQQDGRKLAILTGGSRGLGRCSVLSLASRGVDVVFTYAVNEDLAKEVVAEADDAATVVAMQLDLAEPGSFNQFAEDLKAQLAELGRERFDYLVNNAGASLTAGFEETTEEELDHQYAVNFKGMFFLTQKLLPLLEDGGRILNFSSGLVRFTFPNKIGYATIKSSVEPFTRYLATELADRGIAVNAIAPGAVGTDFSDGLIRDDPEYRKRISDVTALGRPGVPEDIGPMVAALLSDDARWVNGQRIEVSGGMKL